MKQYINELLQETIGTGNDYKVLSETIHDYITKNDESKYNYIIDAIQISILNQTSKFISYQQCEDMYFAIKGFESIYNK